MYSIDAAQSSTGTDVPMLLSAIEEISRQTLRLAHDTSRTAGRLGMAGEHLQIVAEDIAILAGTCSQRTRDTAALIETSIRHSAPVDQLLTQIASAVDAVATAVADVERQLAGVLARISRHAGALRELNPPTELRAKANLLRLAVRELESQLGAEPADHSQHFPPHRSPWTDEIRQRACI